MNRAFLLLGVTLIFMLYYYTQNDMYNQTMIQAKLQQAVARAAHDASIQIDVDLKSEGNLVFDRIKGHDAIVNSLKYNLNLDDQLRPKTNAFLHHPVEIVVEDYVDEQNVQFPYLYQNGNFKTLMHQPSIVLTIKTHSYGISPFSYHGDIYVFSVVNYSGNI